MESLLSLDQAMTVGFRVKYVRGVMSDDDCDERFALTLSKVSNK